MKHLTPEEQKNIEYWLKAGSRTGQFTLNTRQWIKVCVWRTIIKFSLLLKRLIDIIGSACALVILFPLFVGTALLIKKEDGGPVFFGQKRVGYKGTLFIMWKFRSMVINADKLKDNLLQSNEMSGGITFKMKNDPRVTKNGRWIRKYSVDELPQFWNVLRGDMSLVGPRPPVPREVEQYSVEERQRLMAKPGITCFWQVGGRSAIDFTGQVRLDVDYIQSRSLWLDIKLLLKTIPAVLLGKGAY